MVDLERGGVLFAPLGAGRGRRWTTSTVGLPTKGGGALWASTTPPEGNFPSFGTGDWGLTESLASLIWAMRLSKMADVSSWLLGRRSRRWEVPWSSTGRWSCLFPSPSSLAPRRSTSSFSLNPPAPALVRGNGEVTSLSPSSVALRRLKSFTRRSRASITLGPTTPSVSGDWESGRPRFSLIIISALSSSPIAPPTLRDDSVSVAMELTESGLSLAPPSPALMSVRVESKMASEEVGLALEEMARGT